MIPGSRQSDGPPKFYTFSDVVTVPLPARSAAATATAATTAATTPCAAACSTCGLRTGFIDVQCATVHFRTIQLGYCCLGVAAFGHFHEGKSAGLAGFAVGYDVNALDAAILRKR